MQRDIYAVNIRVDSENSENKYNTEELNAILEEAKVRLPRLVARYAKEMDVSYDLNCLLMNVPAYVRKYVIVHELAHRKEMNHSERFWKVVADEIPEYHKAVIWLKKNGDSVIGRLP